MCCTIVGQKYNTTTTTTRCILSDAYGEVCCPHRRAHRPLPDMEDLPPDLLATHAIHDGPWHEHATYPGHLHRVFRLLLLRPWPHVIALGPAIPKTGVATHNKAAFTCRCRSRF